MDNPMTKHRIEQYAHLRREIVMLEESISSAESGGELVTDYANDYSTGHPRTISLRGYGSKAIPRLLARKAELEIECETVERYIETLDDSLMRQLLTRRYVEGYSLSETADKIGYSESQTSRILSKFFEKLRVDA
jgi:DNA-directed RNA polymerase specialized sigma subunit